jgi:hypothetical protein
MGFAKAHELVQDAAQALPHELGVLPSFAIAFVVGAVIGYLVAKATGQRPVTSRCRGSSVVFGLAPVEGSRFRLRVGGRT